MSTKTDKVEVIKKPRGRPTKFRPEMIEILENFGNEGEGQAELCKELGVRDRHTLYHYREKYPKFEAAYQVYLTNVAAWDEKLERAAITGNIKNFNFGAYKMRLANRYPEKYKLENSDTPKTAINIGSLNQLTSNASEEELNKAIQQKLKVLGINKEGTKK